MKQLYDNNFRNNSKNCTYFHSGLQLLLFNIFEDRSFCILLVDLSQDYRNDVLFSSIECANNYLDHISREIVTKILNCALPFVITINIGSGIP